MDKTVNKFLALGSIITIMTAIYLASNIYRNYQQIKLAKAQLQKLKLEKLAKLNSGIGQDDDLDLIMGNGFI